MPAWPSDGTAVDVEVKLRSARQLAAAAGLSIPEMPQVAISTQAAGRDGALRLDPLTLDIGGSRIEGFAETRERDSRALLEARLDADIIDLSQLRGTTVATVAPAVQAGRPARRIPDLPMALPGMRLADVNLGLKAKRVQLPHGVNLSAVVAQLSLAGGRFTADPVAVGFANSRVTAKLLFDASSPETTALEASLRARGVDIDALQPMLPSGVRLAGGHGEIDVGLAARGGSLRQLLGSLNGQLRVVVRDAKMSGLLAGAGGSLLGELVRSFNAPAEAALSQHLKCAVVNVPVRSGVLVSKNAIALETDKIVAAVSGRIDLANETLDLHLRSEAVDTLGPGLTDFASAGRLTGTFAEPTLAVDAKGAAGLGVSAAAAVATGGLSLLAGSLFRAATPPHPCAAALAGAK
jgi:uncharacterized protein involved in outer membrane biogenesis